MADIETVHRTEDGQQRTIKRVTVGAVTYEFEGEPGGEFTYRGDGEIPEAARTALEAHLGEGEHVAAEEDE